MSNQNPSEVHGPIGASNHRSHTSRLIVSLSPTQPALWFPSVVYALSFPAAPFPRGTVPTRARCRAERTGRDGTGHPAVPGLRSEPLRPGGNRFPMSPGSPPSAASRASEGCPSHPISSCFLGQRRRASPAGKGARQHRRSRSPPSPWAPPLSLSIAPASGRSACWAIPEDGIKQQERAWAAGGSGGREVSGTGRGARRHRDAPGTRSAKWLRGPGSCAPQGRTRQRPPLRTAVGPRAPSRPCRRLGSLWSRDKVAAKDAAAAAGAAMATAARPPRAGPARGTGGDGDGDGSGTERGWGRERYRREWGATGKSAGL